jgi:multidrug resistance protein MdtO
VQDLTDWPGIHTCIITCFFVSLGTVGETLHKAALRLAGCLVGAALGIATILLLMPQMTDLGDLLLALACVTFLAGWIASGGERSAYAGWQIGLAYYLTVLQGAGPTLDMETARDRIIGILLGNVVVAIIFTTIWPVSVADTVRGALARAIEQLGGLAALPPLTKADAADPEPGLRAAFANAIEQARGVLVNDIYERPFSRNIGHIDAAVLLEVQALIVPVTVLLGLRRDQAWGDVAAPERAAVLAYHQALAQWFDRCALWIRSGNGGETIAASLPAPPAAAPGPAGRAFGHLAARLAWYRLLDQDIRLILHQVRPHAPGRSRTSELVHAGV